jgi:hypothetical protein
LSVAKDIHKVVTNDEEKKKHEETMKTFNEKLEEMITLQNSAEAKEQERWKEQAQHNKNISNQLAKISEGIE